MVAGLALALDVESPSSRRAWIEMPFSSNDCVLISVALLTEGVD